MMSRDTTVTAFITILAQYVMGAVMLTGIAVIGVIIAALEIVKLTYAVLHYIIRGTSKK